jgi:hypothetical protein
VKPSHLLLLEKMKAMVNSTEHGAIIFLSERTGGMTDVECVTNLRPDDQIKVLRDFLRKMEAKRGVS